MVGIILYSCIVYSCKEKEKDDYEKALYGFEHPQDSTRTKLWWFHGETETTREGITADLESFKEAGVGGVVYYDQTHGKCKGSLDAFSEEWWKMLIFASQEAKRLGLTFEVHTSNGYVAGGPWITPELSMQRVTCADTIVHVDELKNEFTLPSIENPFNYYKDIAILAIPYRENILADSRTIVPKASCNVKGIMGKSFMEPDKYVAIPGQEKGKSVIVTFDFGKPFVARSITYSMKAKGKATTSATNVPASPQETFIGTGYRVLPDIGEIEASNDGVNYWKVSQLPPIYKDHSSWRQKSISFPKTEARYFRLNLHDWNEANEGMKALHFGKVILSAKASIDCWEEKAGLYSEYIEKENTPDYTREEVINADDIIDLTNMTDSVGTVRWNDAPKGKWLIMRFAHVPTGGKTKHGRKNLMGLECDKLSAQATKVQFDNYFKRIADTIRSHSGIITGMAMDSHEAGSQNWTPEFEKEFAKRRGYELRRFLPVLAGYIVESKNSSSGVLYDVRRTIADLVADNYYGTFNRLCKEEGVHFTAQATGNALCLVADQIQAKSRVEKPQGEFWAIHPDGNYDIKESSSTAHIYGKKIASGEAFTDAKFNHPLSYIKQLADYAYAFGLNEFVVCASAYQPWKDSIPGNTGGGRHYCLNRNNTFWDYSRGFWDYQARCSYLMRQGRAVVDLCLYLGDNAPVKILTHRLPEIPIGLDFDAFTTDALLTRMNASKGEINLPDGMKYRLMVLPRNGKITLTALRKIASLVEKGANVYGNRPTGSESAIDKDKTNEYTELVNLLWGKEEKGVRTYGEGKIVWGMKLEEATQIIGLEPDVTLPKERKCYFVHRRLKDAEIYFIDNHEDKPLKHNFIFRTKAENVEIWNPVDGKRKKLNSQTTDDGRTSIELDLESRQSLFVVLHNKKQKEENLLLSKTNVNIDTIRLERPWTIKFNEKLGGPKEKIVLNKLMDWTSHPDKRIKYYSGTACYSYELDKEKADNPEQQYFLKLKLLNGTAHIKLNNRDVGTLWCSPWEIDLTSAIESTEKKRIMLEIEVTNSLINRMIGDLSLKEEERLTYSDTPIVNEKDTLVSSGLIEAEIIVRKETSPSLAIDTTSLSLVDKEGFLWIANENMIQRFDGNFILEIPLPEKEKGDSLNIFFEDREKNFLWLGNKNGTIICFNKENYSFVNGEKEKLINIDFDKYHCDKEYVWLYKKNGEAVYRLHYINGAIEKKVYEQSVKEMCSDEEENYWILTKNGLYLNGFEKILPNSKKVERIKLYRNICIAIEKEKLSLYNLSRKKVRERKFPYPIDINKANIEIENELLKISDGKRNFAYHIIDNKFEQIEKGEEPIQTIPNCQPRVKVTLVKAGNQEVFRGENQNLVLQNNENSIEIYLSYLTPKEYDSNIKGETVRVNENENPSFKKKRVLYQHKLEGIENWSQPENSHIIRYNELKPGNYTLLIKAKEENGKWSNETSWNFTIETSVWMKWQTYAGSITLIIFFIICMSMYRKRNKKRVITEEVRDAVHQSASDKLFLQRMEEILEKNIGNQTFNVDEFARIMNYGRTRFYNHVKELTGKTPNEILKNTRINHAGKLLIETDLSVEEVRKECGFSNVNIFYKSFKQAYGETPTNYRKKKKTEHL